MDNWTKDYSKFQQMDSEATTAFALYRNIGSFVGKKNFPKGTTCLLCDNLMTQAEHLVNKAHGGNHTKHNVIPVCNSHKKKGNHWLQSYSPSEQVTILESTGYDDEARMNPYHEENYELALELRVKIRSLIKDFLIKEGILDG